jgi:hypothetical protein
MTSNRRFGKIFKLGNSFPNVKFEVSTVQKNPMKTLNLEVRFWLEKYKEQDTEHQINNLFRKCKHQLYFNGGDWYDKDKTISIKDVPRDLSLKSSKTFCMFEFTLFNQVEFLNDLHITQELIKITNNLYTSAFEGREDITKSKRE